jgi:diaminopimelate decarboxylase
VTLVIDDSTRADSGVGGVDPERLAAEFGTPLYVYDVGVIDRQVEVLRQALPPTFDIAYAIKANPSLGVVAHLGRLGLGADVASAGELETAIRAGIDRDRIVFTGPGKRDDELQAAVAAGIRAVTVESPGELCRLEAIAGAMGVRVAVLLRAATAASDGSVAIGRADGGKFGMDRDDLLVAARWAARSNRLRLIGVHAFGASNVRDADTLADHIGATADLARDLIRRLRAEGFDDVHLEVIDVGGGLGIPYAEGEEELDLGRLGRQLVGLAGEWATDDDLRDTRVLLEPGRYLVGQAGTYLTRVLDCKTIRGRDVVIVDGGIHHLVRPALVGGSHRVVNLTAREGRPQATVTVAGPLCSGLDVLAEDVRLPQPVVGDLLGVRDTGAYGYTESMPLFLSHPIPAEVAVSGGRVGLLRPRIESATWLATQRLPAWSSSFGDASALSPTRRPAS